MQGNTLMKVRIIVQWFMLVVAVLIAIVDIWAAIKGGTHDTISGRIWDWSKDYTILPFSFGVVCGHLFWGKEK
jgi:hypothetical protein